MNLVDYCQPFVNGASMKWYTQTELRTCQSKVVKFELKKHQIFD